MPRGLLCLWRVNLGGSFIFPFTYSYRLGCRGGVWRCRAREGSAKWPNTDAHSGGEEQWAFLPTRKPQRDSRGMPSTTRESDHEGQTRPCSTAKRVAAARAEMRTLEAGLRMCVVNQLIEAKWPSRARMRSSLASEIPRAGYLVSETTMIAASVLLSSRQVARSKC